MNIFVLSKSPTLAAQYHCDKHVVKMVLETAQLLSTVAGEGYKPTHKNHPCTVWARESLANYHWLYALGQALGQEYTHRYGKVHKSSLVIDSLPYAPATVTGGMSTPFALAMPDEYRTDCPVASYRAYYVGEKSRMLKYTNRRAPEWVEELKR